MFDQDVDEVMKRVCIEIEKRYQMKFLEIGTDADHVHFLVQSVPTYSLTRIVSINMAKEAMVERSFSLNSLSFKDVISMICLLMPY